MIKIPLKELLKEPTEIVDSFLLLDLAANTDKAFIEVRNGPLSATKKNGTVILSLEIARELAKAKAYRYFFRVMQVRQRKMDIDNAEWKLIAEEAFAACEALDKVEDGK